MKTISTEYNDEILAILKNREDILKTFFNLDDCDDEELEKYNKFNNWYRKLNQLEKDIWYICSVTSMSKCAELMQVSKNVIYRRNNELKKQLKKCIGQ